MNAMSMTATPPTLEEVHHLLALHTVHYRKRPPTYQARVLADLAVAWTDEHARVLDLGGGTGLMAEAIQAFLPAGEVVAIDIVDRWFETLSVATATYDGEHIPFDDESFDAATIVNVLHHVPPAARKPIMVELARVVKGPIYIKDHVAAFWLDHLRLWALDAIGNIPFGGQITANYLTLAEWETLARAAGRKLTMCPSGHYRTTSMAVAFPNRLEAVFRLDAPS